MRRTAVVLTTALGVAIVALSGCGSAQATNSGPPSPEAVVAALSAPQAAGTAGVANSRSTRATRSNSGGNVTIEVTWENPWEPGGPITFSVAMNTHSVDLDRFDLGQLAVLRNDLGQEVKPLQWDAPMGGHHRSGLLAFPAQDSSGRPILGRGARSLELVIRDVAGVKERVLKWEVGG